MFPCAWASTHQCIAHRPSPIAHSAGSHWPGVPGPSLVHSSTLSLPPHDTTTTLAFLFTSSVIYLLHPPDPPFFTFLGSSSFSPHSIPQALHLISSLFLLPPPLPVVVTPKTSSRWSPPSLLLPFYNNRTVIFCFRLRLLFSQRPRFCRGSFTLSSVPHRFAFSHHLPVIPLLDFRLFIYLFFAAYLVSPSTSFFDFPCAWPITPLQPYSFTPAATSASYSSSASCICSSIAASGATVGPHPLVTLPSSRYSLLLQGPYFRHTSANLLGSGCDLYRLFSLPLGVDITASSWL